MLKLTIRRQDKPGPPEIREFDRAVVTIGRHPDNDLVLPESTISRQHARIERRDGKYHLVDLGSAHGTYMNKERVKDVIVSSGAEIYLNPFVISVQAKEDEVATRTPVGVDTTASGQGENRSTIFEVDAAPAPTPKPAPPPVHPPAFEPEATPAIGTFLELEASPGPSKRPTAEIEIEDEAPAPPPKPPARAAEPVAAEPPPEEGTVFELSADAVQAAATPPSTVAKGPPPKARTPTPAPAPAPNTAMRAASGTGLAGGAPATRMRRKDEGPKAGPRQPTGTTPPAGGRSAADLQARLPELLDARDHGKVAGILLGIVTLILAVIPAGRGDHGLFFLNNATAVSPVLFWSLIGGSMLAAAAGLLIRMTALRGFALLVAGGVPLGFLLARPPVNSDFGRLLTDASSVPGWRSLAVEGAKHLRLQSPALAAAFALALAVVFVAFRLARLRAASGFPRALGMLGGLALIGSLGIPLPAIGTQAAGPLVASLPALFGASPANLVLLVPALVGGLAAVLVLAPGARWLTVLGRVALLIALAWPACAHLVVNLIASVGEVRTLHEFRMALLPPMLLALAATGLAATLLDFMLGQDPEEQAFLESL